MLTVSSVTNVMFCRVCHYLGVYDIKNKSWTKLREIDSDGYEQYYKLFSVSA